MRKFHTPKRLLVEDLYATLNKSTEIGVITDIYVESGQGTTITVDSSRPSNFTLLNEDGTTTTFKVRDPISFADLVDRYDLKEIPYEEIPYEDLFP